MTIEQYEQYQAAFEPYINEIDLVVFAEETVPLSLIGLQPYEEKINEEPKAIFRKSDSLVMFMELDEALELLRKSKQPE